MDNYFFRQKFPYYIDIKKDSIDVCNRYFKTIGSYIIQRKIKESEIASINTTNDCDVKEQENGIRIYIYNDKTNPVATEKGFESKLWVSYCKRLKTILLLMRGQIPQEQVQL